MGIKDHLVGREPTFSKSLPYLEGQTHLNSVQSPLTGRNSPATDLPSVVLTCLEVFTLSKTLAEV